MPLPSTEAQQDAVEQRDGCVVELACSNCGEAWTVVVAEGADLTDRQVRCPDRDCDGEGTVV